MLKLVLVCLFVEVALAAVAIGPLHKKPAEFANKKGCYIKETNDVISVGKMATPIGKSCLGIRCNEQNLSYLSCGAIQAPKVSEVDLTKPYPDCCPKAIP